MQQVTILREAGRYAGWPANYGIWSWGQEVVLGFTLGYFHQQGQFHARDKSKPFVTMQARSQDGGASWQVRPMPVRTPGNRPLSADEHIDSALQVSPWLDDNEQAPAPCPGGINFAHPNFALLCARSGLRARARSWFYYSYNRGQSWNGPYWLPMFGQSGIAARTDYLISGPGECTLFLTAAKADGDEGRVFCARTTDGGKTFDFLAWVTPEPAGYAIMPASVRLSPSRLLTAVRYAAGRSIKPRPLCWIDLFASHDNGVTWTHLDRLVADTGQGGNPPTLTKLQDGRLCLTYGYRNPPYGIYAKLSQDDGLTWSEPIVLREGAGNHDIGYPRTAQLADGHLVTAYYFNDHADGERYIAATLWRC